MEEEDLPPSPDASPPLNSVPNRQGIPHDSNNNAGGQYGLRTLYQLQNMLTRQLNFQQPPQQLNNTNHTGTDVVIDIPQQNPPYDNSHNNNPTGAANNQGANTGETVTTHEIDGTRLDLQLITNWLEQSIPFVFLLFLLWIYEHRNGLLLFIWATAIFINSNQAVKKQVSLKEKRSTWVLGGIAATLLFHVLFVYFYFRKEELWRYLVSLPPRQPLNIWATFWVIVVNDFIVRFLTIVVKCLVIIAVGNIPPHKRNTQLYSVIESASNTYRTILPVSIWFKFIFNPNEVFSNLISLMYLLIKFNNMYEKGTLFIASLRAYVLREVQYGKYATSEQLILAGDQCTICQEKMSSPIVLHCSHIFCEDCVSEWFERERTCPLCRANVPTAGSRSHSDGSTSLLVQLF